MFPPALPPWLANAIDEAGDSTVILKAGDRPYIIRSETPHHLGGGPVTPGALEGIAQQLLSADEQRMLAAKGSVEVTIEGEQAPVLLRADRLDNDLVIRLRHALALRTETNHNLLAALQGAAVSQQVRDSISTLASRAGDRIRGAGVPPPIADRAEVAAVVPTPEPPPVTEPAAPKPVAMLVDLGRRRATSDADLNDWIASALARRANTLYLRVGMIPFVRIDGRVEVLSTDVVPLSMFEKAGAMLLAGEDGWRRGETDGEWIKDGNATGAIRCQTFTDASGGGLILRFPQTVVSGVEPRIPGHIRAACETRDGLVVISAPLADDVAAMIAAVVLWKTERRPGYVVAFGTHGTLEATGRKAFISERGLPSTDHEMAVALRAAVQEGPDILVINASGSTAPGADSIVSAAIGRLVVIGLVARTAPRALQSLLNDLRHPNGRRTLAAVFRAGCSWRRFGRRDGRSVVVSDILINTERIAEEIENANVAGLHAAQQNQDAGMRSLDAALARAVTRHRITVREAAAAAVDRTQLARLVRRQRREQPIEDRTQRTPVYHNRPAPGA